MTLETLIADPANDDARAFAPSAGSAARDLRAELAKAIAVCRAAEAKHTAAADVLERAEQHRCAASTEARRLKDEFDAFAKASIDAHAAAVFQAMQAGATLPDPPPGPEMDDKPLTRALANLRAVTLAATEAQAVKAAAQNEAGDAAAACRELVEEIMVGEAEQVAAEAIAAIELHWQCIDRLTGMIMIDETRPGGPRLRAFQEDLLERIDRRKAAAARNPLYIEQHRWREHCDGLAAEQRNLWLDYGRRLMSDADATFDVNPEQSQ
jgi:hypothetical protein